MQEKTGYIKAVKKDKKGLLLDDENWYSNNYMNELKCQKGDKVKITLNEKGYLVDAEVLENAAPQAGEKSCSEESNDKLTSVLTSYAKDLSVAHGGKASEYIEDVVSTYKKAKELLSNKEVIQGIPQEQIPNEQTM